MTKTYSFKYYITKYVLLLYFCYFIFTKFPGLREYLTLFNFSQVLYLDCFISYSLNAMQKKCMLRRVFKL